MAHRYHQPIQVTGTDTATGIQPTGFVWRGAQYGIVEVLATWHLQDRWWQASRPEAPAARQASNRFYYRVRCADQQTFDLYYDAAQAGWVLDCVHD